MKRKGRLSYLVEVKTPFWYLKKVHSRNFYGIEPKNMIMCCFGIRGERNFGRAPLPSPPFPLPLRIKPSNFALE